MSKPRKPQIGFRVLVGVEVIVHVDSSHRGIVTEASVDGTIVIVSMLEGKHVGSEIRVHGSTIVARQPCLEHARRQGLVKILDGPLTDKVGWLRAIGDTDGKMKSACVEMSSGEVHNLDLNLVAVAHAPRKIRSVLPPAHPRWPLT